MDNNYNVEEVSLIVFLLTKVNFDKYYSYLTKLNLEQETKSLLKCINEYFKENPSIESVSVPEFMTYFCVKHPVLKKRTSYSYFLSKLGEIQINSKVLEENLNHFMEKYFASEMLLKLTDVLDGVEYDVLDEVQDMITEYKENKVRLDKDDSSLFVDSSLASLLAEESHRPGLKWRLSCLNEDIGELRGCSLGHVYARPDTGKTSFLVSEITNFASQIEPDEYIVWFNNEEKGSKVQLRLYQSVLQASKAQIETFADKAEEMFEQQGGKKIKIYDNSAVRLEDIDQILSSFKVRLVVIDQGDKVKFNGDSNFSTVERLKALYGRFRELAKKYDVPIITVGQASAEAENAKWLTLNHMDFSKTGKPGELDWAIGIGKLHKDSENGIDSVRYISISKNKMNNGHHGKFSVYFNSACALYLDSAKDDHSMVAKELIDAIKKF